MDAQFARLIGAAPSPGPLPAAAAAARPDPVAELVAGAVRDLTLAASVVTGRRWACRGDQDQWHEGADPDAACEDPLRLDTLARRVHRAAAAGGGTPSRDDVARRVAALVEGWTPAQQRHVFGRPVAAAALAAALDRLAAFAPPAVEYFRRHAVPAGAFAPGRDVLAGAALPLRPARLRDAPVDPEATRYLYVRTAERAEVPPAAGGGAAARP